MRSEDFGSDEANSGEIRRLFWLKIGVSFEQAAGETVIFPPGPLGLRVASNVAWGTGGEGDIRSIFAVVVEGRSNDVAIGLHLRCN